MQKNALLLGLAVVTFVGSCSIAQAADGAEYVETLAVSTPRLLHVRL